MQCIDNVTAGSDAEFVPCTCKNCRWSEQEILSVCPLDAANMLLTLENNDETLKGYFKDHVSNAEQMHFITDHEEFFCEQKIQENMIKLAVYKETIENTEMQILSLQNMISRKRYREVATEGVKYDVIFPEKVNYRLKMLKVDAEFPRSTSPTFCPAEEM